MKPRVFFLAKDDLDFDLNWKRVFAAEFPHKDTTDDALIVIEYSAFEDLQKENARLKERVERLRNALKIYAYLIDDIKLPSVGEFSTPVNFVANNALQADDALAKGEK